MAATKQRVSCMLDSYIIRWDRSTDRWGSNENVRNTPCSSTCLSRSVQFSAEELPMLSYTRWMEEDWLVPATPILENHESCEHQKMHHAPVKQTCVEWAQWACWPHQEIDRNCCRPICSANLADEPSCRMKQLENVNGDVTAKKENEISRPKLPETSQL